MSRQMHAARGYSLMEVVVTLAITATMLTVALQWVIGLIGTSNTNLAADATTRAGRVVHDGLVKDMTALLACPATGTPVESADASHVSVYVTTTAGPQLVTWKLDGTTLSRGAVPATLSTAGCGATNPADDPATNPAAGYPIVYGTQVTVVPVSGEPGLVAFTSATSAGASALSVHLSVATDTAAVPVTGTWPLPTGYRQLS